MMRNDEKRCGMMTTCDHVSPERGMMIACHDVMMSSFLSRDHFSSLLIIPMTMRNDEDHCSSFE